MEEQRISHSRLMDGLSGSRYGLSSSTLKLFACITMLIDHTGASVVLQLLNQPAIRANAARYNQILSVYTVMRQIGRLAFPIFCFLIVEGYYHTHDVRKYMGRLFVFALISEIPFDLALKPGWFYPLKQNVYFTLLIGLWTIWTMDQFRFRRMLRLVIALCCCRDRLGNICPAFVYSLLPVQWKARPAAEVLFLPFLSCPFDDSRSDQMALYCKSHMSAVYLSFKRVELIHSATRCGGYAVISCSAFDGKRSPEAMT